jgi:hypothetical protein
MRLPADGNMDPWRRCERGAWRYVKLGPMELAGEFEIMPEGGTMAAENVQQNRQDAQHDPRGGAARAAVGPDGAPADGRPAR